ncbi:class V lanthionine synthetase subunit LxmK [Kitasatospora sp. NPDC059827]|uniref:class V lanthionine synthetase subunit LxmK n=1 Tax=Kitasatospora sp. NPDC059827 TaxID=3346964 RepID=UPI00364BF02E
MDLDDVPEVDEFLGRLGLGPFERASLSAPVGRNDAWAGRTRSGRKVFVKRLLGQPGDVRERMRRLLSFERFRTTLPAGAVRTPRFLGADETFGLVVFDHLDEAVNGAEMMVDETFDDQLSFEVGRTIGRIHAAVPEDPDGFDTTLPALPSTSLLRGMSQQMFEGLSFAGLEAWHLMQGDRGVVEAIAALATEESRAPRVPSHCDLRVDQLLVVRGHLYVADWEEFRLADPARDVGSFAGEWLYRSVLDIVTARGDTAFADVELTHELILDRGTQKLDRLRPRVRHFWSGYLETAPAADDGLIERATAFAGWHLLDRLIAGSAQRSRVSGIERAAAGIGRSALLSPRRFAAAIGLGEAA